MSFNLAHIIASMSPLSLAIAGVLMVMAVLSVGVTVERVSYAAGFRVAVAGAACGLLLFWWFERRAVGGGGMM